MKLRNLLVASGMIQERLSLFFLTNIMVGIFKYLFERRVCFPSTLGAHTFGIDFVIIRKNT